MSEVFRGPLGYRLATPRPFRGTPSTTATGSTSAGSAPQRPGFGAGVVFTKPSGLGAKIGGESVSPRERSPFGFDTGQPDPAQQRLEALSPNSRSAPQRVTSPELKSAEILRNLSPVPRSCALNVQAAASRASGSDARVAPGGVADTSRSKPGPVSAVDRNKSPGNDFAPGFESPGEPRARGLLPGASPGLHDRKPLPRVASPDVAQGELFRQQWSLVRDQMSDLSREVSSLRREVHALQTADASRDKEVLQHFQDVRSVGEREMAERKESVESLTKSLAHLRQWFGAALESLETQAAGQAHGVRALVDAEVRKHSQLGLQGLEGRLEAELQALRLQGERLPKELSALRERLELLEESGPRELAKVASELRARHAELKDLASAAAARDQAARESHATSVRDQALEQQSLVQSSLLREQAARDEHRNQLQGAVDSINARLAADARRAGDLDARR